MLKVRALAQCLVYRGITVHPDPLLQDHQTPAAPSEEFSLISFVRGAVAQHRQPSLFSVEQPASD